MQQRVGSSLLEEQSLAKGRERERRETGEAFQGGEQGGSTPLSSFKPPPLPLRLPPPPGPLLPSLTQPDFSKEMVAVVTPSLPLLLRPVPVWLLPHSFTEIALTGVISDLDTARPTGPLLSSALCRSAAIHHSRPSGNRSFGSQEPTFSWFHPPSVVFIRFLCCLFFLYLTN